VSLSLARNPDISAFAHALVERTPRDRLARLTTVFSFVANLVEAKAPEDGVRDGVDWLLALAGEAEGRALILSSLLLALGERAAVESRAGSTFVRVELDPADVKRLPPHARPYSRCGRVFIPLDARRARAPFGFVPDRWLRPLLLR
jgi:hypothetical protein